MLYLESLNVKYIKKVNARSPYAIGGMTLYETNRVIANWAITGLSVVGFGVAVIAATASVGTLIHFLTKEKEYIVIPCPDPPNCSIPVLS